MNRMTFPPSVLEDSDDPLDRVVCPLCHTPTALGPRAFAAGGVTRCSRCGQQWDAARLTAVARFAERTAENAARAAGSS